jgi:6-phosphogluconolactonase (cycloisomerase 2 family)
MEQGQRNLSLWVTASCALLALGLAGCGGGGGGGGSAGGGNPPPPPKLLDFAYMCGGSTIAIFPVSNSTGIFGPAQDSGIPLGSEGRCAMHPSGKYLYVPSGFSATSLPPTLARSIVNFLKVNATDGSLVAGPPGIIDAAANTLPENGVVDPSGRFLFVSSTTTRQVSSFVISPADGSLAAAPGGPFPASPAPALPQPVSSPFATHPSAKFVYAGLDDGNNAVVPFTVNQTNGVLSLGASVTLAGSFPIFPSYLAMHPKGNRLYVATTVPDIQVFDVDASDGSLTAQSSLTFALPNVPVAIGFDVSGTYLYVGLIGGISDNLRAYQVASATGALTEITGSPFTATAVVSADFTNPIPVPTSYGAMDGFSSVVADPTGRFLYVTSSVGFMGTDGFSIDPQTGRLTHLGGTASIPHDFPILGANTDIVQFTTK